MKDQIRPALVCFLLLTLITGVVYPVLITGVGILLFPEEASGSLIHHDGRIIGSALIGQPFDDPKYFWSRPSATGPFPYNAEASSGSNWGPGNTQLHEAARQRIARLKEFDPQKDAPPPVDLVTASASGLDPHISIAAAEYQIARVARERHLPVDQVQAMVKQHTEARTFGVLGEPRVNVLLLNLALDHPEISDSTPRVRRSSGPILYRWRGFLPESR